MRKNNIFAALAAAALVCSSAGAMPASAAAEFGSAVYLAETQGEKSYIMFYGNGTGTIHSTGTGRPFRYEMTGASVATFYFYGESEPFSATVIEENSGLSLLWADGTLSALTYLQEYTADAYTKSCAAGDITLDGNLSHYDAMMLQKFLLSSYQMNTMQQAMADFNGDHVVNAADLSLLKQKLAAPEAYTPKKIMLNAPEISQHPTYPTGCESIALYILLQYYGTAATPEQIVEALPKGPLPYESDGRMVGANPEREFVGDPRSSYSYGVFNEPIAKTAAKFRSGAITKKGVPLEALPKILETGNPIVVWYTTTPDRAIYYNNSWYDYLTGELIRWPAGEHAVVVCGYDEAADTITYRDPNTGGSRTLTMTQFAVTYNELGSRIVYYQS
jgi:uncharacterized protein YvpB